jgi:hypothetical protein
MALFKVRYFKTSGPQLFEGLRIALTESLGFQPTFERVANILDENVSAVQIDSRANWPAIGPHVPNAFLRD